MGFRLANVDNRAVLVEGDHYYDVETLSGGSLGSPGDSLGRLRSAGPAQKREGRISFFSVTAAVSAAS